MIFIKNFTTETSLQQKHTINQIKNALPTGSMPPDNLTGSTVEVDMWRADTYSFNPSADT